MIARLRRWWYRWRLGIKPFRVEDYLDDPIVRSHYREFMRDGDGSLAPCGACGEELVDAGVLGVNCVNPDCPDNVALKKLLRGIFK